MLEPEELAELEATLLPALERHHLRLLAHGLRTLQTIAGCQQGPCPDPDAIRAWCADQPLIADDPGFADAFATQMNGAAAQLTAIATARGGAPLALSLADLAGWAIDQADQRLGTDARSRSGVSPSADPEDPPPG